MQKQKTSKKKQRTSSIKLLFSLRSEDTQPKGIMLSLLRRFVALFNKKEVHLNTILNVLFPFPLVFVWNFPIKTIRKVAELNQCRQRLWFQRLVPFSISQDEAANPSVHLVLCKTREPRHVLMLLQHSHPGSF